MSLYLRSFTLMLAGLAAPLGALAQADQAPPATAPSQSSAPTSGALPSEPMPSRSMPRRPLPSSAQSEAGEPRAITSAADPGPAAQPAAAAARPAPARSPGVSASGPHASAGAAPGGKPPAVDRLELGTATVTGDREQPKVMYIVPWKRSDIGDLSGKPMNSLLDEALAPVDREEFKRQVMYYQVVKADASQNGAAKAPAAQGEK